MRTDERTPTDRDFDRSSTDPYASTANGSSLSGHERNALFLNRGGHQFEDVSGVSGVDHPADGRAVALLDYDRDGWQDLVVVNANSPPLQLFRNALGDAAAPGANALALRFVGGNHEARPAPGLSARDGIGALAHIELPDATLVREHRAGEGFAAQNSSTLLVGLGSATQARRIRVRWPSGRTQESGPVPAGSLVTVYEDPTQSPDGQAFRLQRYGIPDLAKGAAQRRSLREREEQRLHLASANGNGARLRVITTMATWCEACRGELPQLARLRGAFGREQLALLGVPVDEDDDRAKLEEYERTHTPAYELLKTLSQQEIETVRRLVREELRVDALPAAIVTDAQGRVLRTKSEVPSVSEVRELLAELES